MRCVSECQRGCAAANVFLCARGAEGVCACVHVCMYAGAAPKKRNTEAKNTQRGTQKHTHRDKQKHKHKETHKNTHTHVHEHTHTDAQTRKHTKKYKKYTPALKHAHKDRQRGAGGRFIPPMTARGVGVSALAALRPKFTRTAWHGTARLVLVLVLGWLGAKPRSKPATGTHTAGRQRVRGCLSASLLLIIISTVGRYCTFVPLRSRCGGKKIAAGARQGFFFFFRYVLDYLHTVLL